MLIKIAVLYNESGYPRAIRYLQWNYRELSPFATDYIKTVPCSIEIASIPMHRVFDISLDKISGYKNLGVSFNYTSLGRRVYGSSFVTFREKMGAVSAGVRADGTVVDDCILVLGKYSKGKDLQYLVTDCKGDIGLYSASVINKLKSESTIKVNLEYEWQQRIGADLRFATDAYRKQFQDLSMSAHLFDAVLCYDESIGRSVWEVYGNQTAIIPNDVQVVSCSEDVDTVVCPRTCDFMAGREGSSIFMRRLKSPEVCQYFRLLCESDMETCTLPKQVTGTVTFPGEFRVDVFGLPDSVRCIDQSKWGVLGVNSLAVRGSSHLESVVFKEVGTRLNNLYLTGDYLRRVKIISAQCKAISEGFSGSRLHGVHLVNVPVLENVDVTTEEFGYFNVHLEGKLPRMVTMKFRHGVKNLSLRIDSTTLKGFRMLIIGAIDNYKLTNLNTKIEIVSTKNLQKPVEEQDAPFGLIAFQEVEE